MGHHNHQSLLEILMDLLLQLHNKTVMDLHKPLLNRIVMGHPKVQFNLVTLPQLPNLPKAKEVQATKDTTTTTTLLGRVFQKYTMKKMKVDSLEEFWMEDWLDC